MLPLIREAQHGGQRHPDHPQLLRLGAGEPPGSLQGGEGADGTQQGGREQAGGDPEHLHVSLDQVSEDFPENLNHHQE